MPKYLKVLLRNNSLWLCSHFLKKSLTIYCQSDISFWNSYTRNNGLAGVCSSILLGNSLQLQGVAITEHLVRDPKRQVRNVLEREKARNKAVEGRQKKRKPLPGAPSLRRQNRGGLTIVTNAGGWSLISLWRALITALSTSATAEWPCCWGDCCN